MPPELTTNPHHHAHGPANRRARILPTAAPLFVRPPGAQARAGVIVLHDVYGLCDDVEQRCRDLARCGYVAVAPYLHYQTGGKEFRPADERAALAAMSRLSPDDLAADISAALEYLTAKKGIPARRVGIVGRGLGGYLATRACAEHALAGAVAFDPIGVESAPWQEEPAVVDLLGRLRTLWLGIVGTADARQRTALLDAAGRSNATADVRVVEGADRGPDVFGSWDEAVHFLQAASDPAPGGSAAGQRDGRLRDGEES